MKWQAYLTHDRVTTITSVQIKKDPKYFKKYFADLNNPTDDEVRAYFESYFEDMSDPWEIPANGEFKIDKTSDKEDALLKVGDQCNGDVYGVITRLADNKLEICIGNDKFIVQAAAPVRITKQ